jgi:hypothetical protein
VTGLRNLTVMADRRSVGRVFSVCSVQAHPGVCVHARACVCACVCVWVGGEGRARACVQIVRSLDEETAF